MMELKVCGVVNEHELLELDRLGVDYAGLWFHIPKGKYELSKERFKVLSHTDVKNVRCIGVTMDGDAGRIVDFILDANLCALQLHGFQLPTVISTLRGQLDGAVEIIKVLHIREEQCLEQPFIDRYIEAGTDAFILDCFISRDKIGSTGQRASLNIITKLIDQLGSNKVFIAGGLDEEAISGLHAYSGLRGVDVDTGARKQGRISTQLVQALARSAQWNNKEELR